MRSLPPDVHRLQADVARQLLFDGGDRLPQLRLRQVHGYLHASGWQNDRTASKRWVGIAGLNDRLDPLMCAVELNYLLVRLRVEPIEEQAAAAADRRLAALERRPHDAAARRDVEAADVRLHLLPHAAADRQILAR